MESEIWNHVSYGAVVFQIRKFLPFIHNYVIIYYFPAWVSFPKAGLVWLAGVNKCNIIADYLQYCVMDWISYARLVCIPSQNTFTQPGIPFIAKVAERYAIIHHGCPSVPRINNKLPNSTSNSIISQNPALWRTIAQFNVLSNRVLTGWVWQVVRVSSCRNNEESRGLWNT